MGARDGGSGDGWWRRVVETGGGDGSEIGLVMKKEKQKSTTGIGASLIPDYRDKEVSVPASPGLQG